MGLAVKIIRFPIAVISSLIVIIFWLVIFPLELALVIVTFPLAALFLSKSSVSDIYGGFPYSWKYMKNSLESVWNWVSSESAGVFNSGGCILVLVGIVIAIILYLSTRH
jgi:hypothetical protein